MWFSPNDINIHNPIKVLDLRGYVLPHAGTKYTGEIISHTLRFRPTKKIKRIFIIYYPATKEPDVEDMYHEYYVPLMSLQAVFGKKHLQYIGINVQQDYRVPKVKGDDLVVVSADFSHFLPLKEAIHLENKAAHSLMFRNLSDTNYNAIIDDRRSFSLYQMISKNTTLQWVGRSRSSGMKGVGYLSFLIRDIPKPHLQKPNGMFVTVYDKEMNSRECLGEWFTKNRPWNKRKENQFVKEVLQKASQTSRLTGGMDLGIPVTNYTITYLYMDRRNGFIRGWHGLRETAFYLSHIFLENTYEDGRWIKKSDKSWETQGQSFNLKETFQKLQNKSGSQKTISKHNRYHLYTERVIHKSVS